MSASAFPPASGRPPRSGAAAPSGAATNGTATGGTGENREGPAAAAFAVAEPLAVMSPAVFATPHSGRVYPADFLDACGATLIELRRIEDALVDRLLADVPQHGAPVLRGLIARACVDLNREETELDPDMFSDPPAAWTQRRSPRVEAGLGCLPRLAFNGAPIYARKLRRAEAEARIGGVHRPYHRALVALLRRAEAMFGAAFLIDCHSMPTDAEGARGLDVIIGDRFGQSCTAAFAETAEAAFRRRGYRTGRNAPYAGGWSTVAHGQPGLGRHAVQIELRRGLYLDELAVEPNAGFAETKRALTDVAGELAALARELSPAARAGNGRGERAAAE
jgi:N-formylglutamate amidohydrolase